MAMQAELEAQKRRESMYAESEDSQTAAEFINSQLALEAEAREALPYKFDTCTRPLGALRQLLFACLTCNPPPKDDASSSSYTPAAVCYSCSVSCHGDHELAELFHKRNFVCDCGTTRISSTSPNSTPCLLRVDENGVKGARNEDGNPNNQYNQNFGNKFCGCGDDYDPHQQKGTMYQCIGLKEGCGEDWWHPTCVVGLTTSWFEAALAQRKNARKAIKARKAERRQAAQLSAIEAKGPGGTQSFSSPKATAPEFVGDEGDGDETSDDEDDTPVPPGFPNDDEFDGFICYKCVGANPWIRKYAGLDGFFEPVFQRSAVPSPESQVAIGNTATGSDVERNPFEVFEAMSKDARQRFVASFSSMADPPTAVTPFTESLKRKADSDLTSDTPKHAKTLTPSSVNGTGTATTSTTGCSATDLVEPTGQFSLMLQSDFRNAFCRCNSCYPFLAASPQLLEEEDNYEPPVSEGSDADGQSSKGSLLNRGERALNNMDRVKAIEGVMAFNKLKEKLTPFFKEFAESGRVISAEDIKEHFAKMRGDDQGQAEAQKQVENGGDGGGADQRK